MSTSSIIFGLVLTLALFLIHRGFKKAALFNQLFISAHQANKKFLLENDELIDKLNQTITKKLELEEELENARSIITNLRRAERKHVATIKKLSSGK